MSPLNEQIDRTIASRRLFRRGQKILAAVSGGVDSMALLHLLHDLSGRYGWRITVAHFNHCLRGRSSDADERLVVRAAKKLGLAVAVKRSEAGEFARQKKLSLEMAARELRHEFLADTATRLDIPTVALAHHADDQVELFFVRLFRGSGGEGLAGMRWKSSSPANPKIELARPLLGTSKATLRAYTAAHRVPFREDKSNSSLDIRRNRIRHKLLPLLRRVYQPALDEIILRTAEIIGADAECAGETARLWLRRHQQPESAPPRGFNDLSLAVQRRCLQAQLIQKNIVPEFALVESLRARANKKISVAAGLCAWRDEAGRLEVDRANQALHRTEAAAHILRGNRGQLGAGMAAIRWKIMPHKANRQPRWRPGREFFDADKIGSRVVLRYWRPGDRFQPIGMLHPVKLQDLFTNLKIPRAHRHELVVATAKSGEIFWVEGLRISEAFKLSARTRRRLSWEWRNHPE